MGPPLLHWTPMKVNPGPILLQGDRGMVEFRRIVVYPLIKKP